MKFFAMNTSSIIRLLRSRVACAGLLFALSLGLTAVSARAQTTAGPFVEPIQGFVPIDTTVNPADGSIYVLGWDESSGEPVLQKYDAAGIQGVWPSSGTQNLELGLYFAPAAITVSPDSGNLFIVGQDVIVSVDSVSGDVLQSQTAGNGNVDLQSVYYFNHTLYTCGEYS